ncbi:uncharacterized protein KY384_002237 [Bacidia gigantensis]|uniref:uncharacterized protein n=1 Tax=Bacidia gigantensis TaxID=2732470 RepID=UPI001D03F65D|nr:uncharacterized protein KY384_002237 [Bacidia gigantensis]KAG8533454.1 hypothetical protein KY384_002237 [Bacidia gigantensis]
MESEEAPTEPLLPPSRAVITMWMRVVTLGVTGRHMCEGEFESLKAIYEVYPGFVPEPHAWGKYTQPDPETYFLLVEFRDVGEQPASPAKLASSLAKLHKQSMSSTEKFGFHISTCHAKIAQAVNTWEDSWCALYSKHLEHVMNLAKPILQWPEFDVVCKLTIEKVVPRLLLPLQSDGRILKPCLLHGDFWDGNTALDQRTGNAFVFDVCSFYGHNEYDTGNWRAPRHRLSNKAYIREYTAQYPVSPPEDDWDMRNLLYSLTFNIANTIYIPGSSQRQGVYDDMTTLCKKLCPEDLNRELKHEGSIDPDMDQATAGMGYQGEDREEKQEEEKEK